MSFLMGILWISRTSTYEGVNVECMRNRCGEILSQRDDADVDSVAGVPDSGTAHAVGICEC